MLRARIVPVCVRERESLWVGGWVLFTLLVYKKGQFKLTDVIADMT